MIRNQKIKGTFICGTLFFKWMGVFQSWLDSFSIGVWTFIRNRNFLTSVVLYTGAPFVTIFKCCNLQYHYTFFQVHQTASDIVPVLYNKPCTSTGDYYIWKRFLVISSKDINLQYICEVYFREQGQHLRQQKRRTLLALHFLKKTSYLEFFKIQCQKILLPSRAHFNKVNRAIYQKLVEVVTQNWPGRLFCSDKCLVIFRYCIISFRQFINL